MDKVGPCFNVDPCDLKSVQELAIQLAPDLIIVGPEAPLAAGVSDALRARGFDVFGPSQEASQLESSKAFSKDKMKKYGVPTARYGRFSDVDEAIEFLDTMEAPYVLKADGLAAGKGVVIAETLAEAAEEIEAMLGGKFGEASSELVIEEFMKGEEASIFVLTDGDGALYLPACQDHKRAHDGDTGLNTGGMGAYAPAPVITPRAMELIQAQIAEPMLDGMAQDGMPYQGVLYIGVMITDEGPKVVEFNARFGDPECQVLMAGLPGDIVPALLMCATGGLTNAHSFLADQMGLRAFRPAASVVMASKGYPEAYKKETFINGVEHAEEIDGVTVFHAGTEIHKTGSLMSYGGRVLNVTGVGETLKEAIDLAYQGVSKIDWPEGFNRTDIGWRALERES